MAKGISSLFAISTCTQLISLLFLCLLLLAPVHAQNRSDEVSALQIFISQNFKVITGYGTNWIRGGHWVTWNFSDENACTWIGVTCTTNFTVAELDFSEWSMLSISFESLSPLRDLKHLDLSDNNLGTWAENLDAGVVGGVVSLSSDIGTLTGLTWLDLSNNNLQGEIPGNISACRHLRYLSLEQNQFSGSIPSTLSDLKDLQILLLAGNQLSGLFPTQLTEIISLVTIDLSYNSFSGPISALPNLTKLTSLRLDNNSFTMFEKSWFSTVSQSLQIMSVSFNQLEDVLPTNITVGDIEVFNMSGNRLSGPIPRFSTPRFYAFSVDLSQNNFTGEIPNDLFYTNFSCNSLNLSSNFLTGKVPFNGIYGNCFKTLDLSHNNLSGLIPSNVFNFTGITALYLGNNNLSGDIVDILNTNGTLGYITELHLENNLFTGDLSMLTELAVQFLSGVEVLDFTNNQLQWSVSAGVADPITATLQKLTKVPSKLRQFLAGGNNFSGTSLPTACVNEGSPRIDKLQTLDLSDTHLNGKIWTTAFNGSCFTSLQSLDLSNNLIYGIVPDSIVALPGLQILNLSYNHLSGQLPPFLSSTSFNNPRFFEGNDGLCGYPLPSCPQDARRTGIQWWVLLVIIAGCVMIALGSCLMATWRWRVYRERHQQDEDLIKELRERESATLMPLRLLMKVTKNFAESAQIGEGGFGNVYVGKLNNGTMVAVKRSKREGSIKDKERFLNEVRILSQVIHRNLVKLLGCCMENKIALLVFEYIPNGTLQEHLSGKIGTDRLTWKQRVKIAVQTADALDYLHTGAVFPIYHRDVKSANILLDENCNAKVADFGISKLAPLQVTHVSTIAVQGTLGYIDPEYYTSYKLTDKSDVYSFGVVLLELISAKPALDFQRGGDETSLVYFASPYIERGDLQELVDPNLIETYNDVVGSGRKSILAFSKLAMTCSDTQSKARPRMNEVLKELRILWTELEGKSKHLEDSIDTDDNEALHRGHRVQLSQFSSEDSSSFAMETDGSNTQM